MRVLNPVDLQAVATEYGVSVADVNLIRDWWQADKSPFLGNPVHGSIFRKGNEVRYVHAVDDRFIYYIEQESESRWKPLVSIGSAVWNVWAKGARKL